MYEHNRRGENRILAVYYDIISNMIKAHRQSRVDAFIQSTDKNFLVPVGGSVVVSCNESFIREVAQTYPGKSPIIPLYDDSVYIPCYRERLWITLPGRVYNSSLSW